MVDVETFDVLTAHHVRTQQIVILIRHAGQDLIVKACNIHIPLQIRAGAVHALGRALGRIHAAGQVAGFCIVGHHAGLVIAVFILAVAVVELRGPLAVKTVFRVQLRQIGLTIGHVKRLVKAGFAIDINGFFSVEIEDRSAIERRFIVAMRIEHGHGGIIAEPGERRGDKGAAFVAKITPVIFVLILTREAIRQTRAVDRAGHIDLSGAAAKAGGGGGQRTTEGSLRAFGDDVNQAARIENAIQR